MLDVHSTLSKHFTPPKTTTASTDSWLMVFNNTFSTNTIYSEYEIYHVGPGTR